MNLLDAIPNLREAIERERLAREADFLGAPTNLLGFELQPITLTRLAILRLMDSPFLYLQAKQSKIETAQFLWVVSQYFRTGKKRRVVRWLFYRRCRRVFARPKNLVAVVSGIQKWLDETFEDAPPSPATAKGASSYYCGAASICGALAREFGWDEHKVLEMPLRRIFQYLNEMRHRNNPKGVMFNPSDRVIASWLETINSKPSQS